MIQITNIGQDPHQKIPVVLEDGTEIVFILDYRPTQEAWFWGIEYGEFKTLGNRLCAFPNLLRRFANIINFGLMVTVSDNGEVWFKDDFYTNRVSVYFLNSVDVARIESEVFTK